MESSYTELQEVRAAAELLVDGHEIDLALARIARQLNELYADKTALLLCVMNGGLVTAGHLTTRLSFLLELGYLHVTRYRGATSGGELSWKREPEVRLDGRDIILVDDIFDEGHTLAAIDRYCREHGARSVRSVVLVEKEHDRKVAGFAPDLVGLRVDDRYVFGFGMDYKEYFRNLPEIYAVT